MSFEWKGCIDLADELLVLYDSGTIADATVQEACLRSVISRAYYGVLGIAAEHVGFTSADPSFGSHDTVINKLFQPASEIRKRLCKDLRNLKKERVQADYYAITERAFDRGRADDACVLANSMLGDFQLIGALGQDYGRPK